MRPHPFRGIEPAAVDANLPLLGSDFNLLLLYPFPAGMVLYWTVANVLHLLHQTVVRHASASVV